MLNPADVLVDGHEVLRGDRGEGLLGVPRIAEAQEVPRRVDERVHGVRLAPGRPAADRARRVEKAFVEGQRRLPRRQEFDVIGRHDRELILGHRHHAVVGAVHGWDGTTPKALARHQPVAQPVVDLALADALLLEPVERPDLRRVDVEPVEEPAVDFEAVARVRLSPVGVPVRRGLHGAHDRELVLGGERPVALVLGGHGHDRSGPVAHEHVVGHVERDGIAGERIDDVASGEGAPLAERGVSPSVMRSMSVAAAARVRRASTAARRSSVVNSSTRGCSGAMTA